MRLALAQINPTVGDIPGNEALIARFIARARDAGAELVVFPELAVSGYPPKDLLLREGFVAACAAAAKRIGETHTVGLAAVFGCPLPLDPQNPGAGTANSLLVYRDGKYLDHYDKRLLPTYDVFDEDRYFVPGTRAVVVEVGGVKVGLAICEDLWKGEDAGFSWRYAAAPDPMRELAAAGAELVVVPSASPFVLGKGARHRAILAKHARTHGYGIASVNQVGGNDDLVFDGHAAVYDSGGGLLAAGPGFGEHLVVTEIGVARLPCISPIGPLGPIGPIHHATPPTADPLLSVPPEQLLFQALTLGTRDYLHKTGHQAGIIGLSGGIDSAVTAAVAAAALGPENVLGVAMPSLYSSGHSKIDAYDLARRLGIRCLTIAIAEPFDGFRAALDPAFDDLDQPRLAASLPDLTEENIQSRVRGTLLMALSNRTGALLLTTGNKSELAVGYCTLYGDMNGGLAVLSDVSKQQVYALARWINANWASLMPGAGEDAKRHGPIPASSIEKPPSAELRPNQTDQDSLPPYDVLDRIIERYVEGHQSPARIIAETGIDAATVHRVARMIDLAEFKRKQTAVGLKVTSVAFGAGRRQPIAQGWTRASGWISENRA